MATLEEKLAAANAENERLTTEAKAADEKHAQELEAGQALAAEAEKKATEAQAQVEKLKGEAKAKDETIAKLTTERDALAKEAEAVKEVAATLANIGIVAGATAVEQREALKAHTDKLASAKALEITASQGSGEPLAVGASGKQGEAAPKGREAVKAAMCKNLAGAN